MPTTNPFDDDHDEIINHNKNSNSISYENGNSNDNEYYHSEDEYDDDDDDDEYDDYDANQGTDPANGLSQPKQDQPVEASWQFLGDLPYRKITLYDDIQWGVKPSIDNENIRRDDEKKGLTSKHDLMNNSNERQEGQGGEDEEEYGLSYLQSSKRMLHNFNNLNKAEYEQYIRSTTNTIITSCPNGGPIATVTVPITNTTSYSKSITSASVRIMTNSGQLLSTIVFPPLPTGKGKRNWFSKRMNRQKNATTYTPNDIFTIGFTGRCILVIVLRDSLCLTYTLSGKPVLDPFYIFNHQNLSQPNTNVKPRSGGSVGSNTSAEQQRKASLVEVIDATIYDGGVAVLCSNMTSAIVELLNSDEESDTFYREGCHVASRVVKSVDFDEGQTASSATANNQKSNDLSNTGGEGGNKGGSGNSPMDDDHNTTSMYALITPLSTSTHAKSNYITYTSIAVLPRIHTQSRHPEVFLGTSNNSVIVCDASSNGSIVDTYCQERISSPIVRMKFAPNGRFLACFTQQCIMTVISTNFETKVLDFDTSDGSNEIPNNIEWCGEDSVVLHWKNLGVLMVGPYGDWLRFPYENIEYLHLSAEMDCCRVVTDSNVEILQRVPPDTAAMLRIGSIEPAAMLLDASDAFENGSPASDEAARAITKTGMLLKATAVCIDAAAREFDINMQKRLLRAASYGMHFEYKDGSNPRGIMGGRKTKLPNGQEVVHPSPIAMSFVESAKKIRVLNALRNPSVGVAMTVAQYDAIEGNGVISRLIAMKRPALATSLSTYLQLNESVKTYARASRASAFVTVDVGHTDAETAEAAVKILNAEVKSPIMNRGAYATVALAAFKAGRQGVSSLLLTLEASVLDKVPALTTIGLYSDAATVAADARIDDLIFHVLMEFEKYCGQNIPEAGRAQNTYLTAITQKFPPEAVNLLVQYFSSMNDVKHVMNLQVKAQNYAKAGSIIAERALNLPREHERLSMIQEASRIFGIGRDAVFQKTCTDEYLELLLEQERLRRAYGPDVTTKTSSVTETIFNVLCYAAVKMRESRKLLAEGEKIAKKFKVPDKRLWHTKIRAFAATDQWTNLRTLSESKTKPPIGFKYFALAVIKKKQSNVEILRYIEKVTDSEERYDLFCEAKYWKRAIEEARKMDDVNRIMNVRTVCNIPEIQQLCEKYAASMM